MLLEPLYQQIIFVQGFLLLQGDSPVCRRQDLMHTGGLKNPLWPNSGLSPFCWPPHHTIGVPNPAVQSQTFSATIAALPSCSTLLTWGEGTKPPLGALKMLNAEHTQSACNSCLLPGPAIIPVWAWGRLSSRQCELLTSFEPGSQENQNLSPVPTPCADLASPSAWHLSCQASSSFKAVRLVLQMSQCLF